MAACAKHVFLLTDATKVEETMRTAFDIARSGRPGPVVVDLPKDVQLVEQPFRGTGMLPNHGYRRRMQALSEHRMAADDAKAFFRMLEQSERPLIYAGGGTINADASQELRAFSKKFGIPVVTTLMGIGAMDTTS